MALGEALKELTKKPAFWLMTAGATIAAFCGYGISSFQSIFFVRSHGITAGEAAIWINTPVALAAAFGTFGTGDVRAKIGELLVDMFVTTIDVVNAPDFGGSFRV